LPEEKELDYYSPRVEVRLTLPSLIIHKTNNIMAKTKTFHIITVIDKDSIFNGSYDDCVDFLNKKTKVFRKLHKLVSDEDYQKIIKKKPTQ
jgi:hypothetical protein